MNLYSDAWTSGNPGRGGCRVTDEKGKIIVSKDTDNIHTNNFFEIYGIYLAVCEGEKISKTGEKVDLYSDSQTAISWIANGKHKATRDRESITKLILMTRDIIKKSNGILQIKKWDTELNGEIPADYGRK